MYMPLGRFSKASVVAYFVTNQNTVNRENVYYGIVGRHVLDTKFFFFFCAYNYSIVNFGIARNRNFDILFVFVQV